MVDINTFLLMLLYLLGAVLLVCLIILVIKSIGILNRVNRVLDDVDNKLIKMDKVFNIIDVATDNVALISDLVVDGVSNFIRKIFKNKKEIKFRKGEEINNEQ